ncbi:antitoxin VbhA family protein [Clostridium estertheticum]|uniref:antitoxin VbhA family protein n=1 Tax=Clostridium estertheticum TaxID=238834 RepID=UPI001C0E4C7A|nr:antitoxin VbhA family protein [Clostridium estertheticum]MBU3173365.1 antitoxin VbhA family protein [Clostridium estertheticum]
MNKKLPGKEMKKMLDNAKASLAIEGMVVTEKETKILEDYISGVISKVDFFKILNDKGVN